MFLDYAKLYNNLKIKLDKKSMKSDDEIKLLSKYFEESNKFKIARNELEKKLIEHGINPSEQFGNGHDSGRDNSPSSDNIDYYSDHSKSSTASKDRSNKRVKYSHSEFFFCFVGFNLTPILQLLSCIFSAILLLVIHFNLLPSLDLD